ncbi:unnamed protein product [Pocillopora meandrina]|uniref:Uncharacterized protein n=1 Tax=Pocillopora meandrina TaxID=46732 RepID=A0AAU9VPC1_9CNID|nr:unnamed protein product [Pocillopora meandrina]
MEKLLHASKDQINAVSEFTLNMLKKKIPLSPPTVAKLKKYRVMLRELGKRRNSLRKRRQLLVNQTGGSFWSALVAIMETFLMVKPDEFRALVDYYKGKITESTLLDKAARVAAEAKLLLEDTSTPAALKEPVVKELLMQERKLTDKLRQIPIAGGVEPPPRDDDGNLMEGLQEGLLKELIKSINMRGQAAVPEMTLKREPVTPVGIKNEPVTPAKPGTSKIPFLTAPSQKIQKTKRKLPVPTPQKHRTELERLKEFGNWEPWERERLRPISSV